MTSQYYHNTNNQQQTKRTSKNSTDATTLHDTLYFQDPKQLSPGNTIFRYQNYLSNQAKQSNIPNLYLKIRQTRICKAINLIFYTYCGFWVSELKVN